MIESFDDTETEKLFKTGKSRRFPSEIISTAIRKLDYLDKAKTLEDLKIPPGNKLEKLRGKFYGKYCIRINDRYRIVFEFKEGKVFSVQIIDYH